MLRYNKKIKSDRLSDQFDGMDEYSFENAAKLWNETQSKLNERLKQDLKEQSDGGSAFDVRNLLEIFFDNFNTQELQNVALVQFLMLDLNQRMHAMMGGGMQGMLEELKSKLKEGIESLGGDLSDLEEDKDNPPKDEDVDFEELI